MYVCDLGGFAEPAAITRAAPAATASLGSTPLSWLLITPLRLAAAAAPHVLLPYLQP